MTRFVQVNNADVDTFPHYYNIDYLADIHVSRVSTSPDDWVVQATWTGQATPYATVTLSDHGTDDAGAVAAAAAIAAAAGTIITP